MLLNSGAGDDSWESLGQQGDQTNPKGNQPWIFFGRTDAEAPIICSPEAKCQFIGKDPDAEKDWRQKEKRVAENEMFGWHHWFSGHKFGQTMRWWGTGRPGVLQFMGSQNQTHLGDWTTTTPPQQLFHLSFLYHVYLLAIIVYNWSIFWRHCFPCDYLKWKILFVNQNSGNTLKIFSRNLAKQFTNITSFHVS